MSQEQESPKGFTLIELMIAVAIVGLLAAIAIPAYSDYVKRGQVVEMVSFASPLKASFSEFHQATASWPSDITEAGYDGSTSSPMVKSVSGLEDTIVLEGKSDLTGLTLTYVGSVSSTTGVISWTCTASGANARHAPANCR